LAGKNRSFLEDIFPITRFLLPEISHLVLPERKLFEKLSSSVCGDWFILEVTSETAPRAVALRRKLLNEELQNLYYSPNVISQGG
jgi:hypothetical protein